MRDEFREDNGGDGEECESGGEARPEELLRMRVVAD